MGVSSVEGPSGGLIRALRRCPAHGVGVPTARLGLRRRNARWPGRASPQPAAPAVAGPRPVIGGAARAGPGRRYAAANFVTACGPTARNGATMNPVTIRPAYSSWPTINARLREVVRGLTADQLAIQPSDPRWPLWATIGHAACQRVFWLCDFAGEPGAETTPFPNAGSDCPGDDDLEHVLDAGQLVEALDASFRIVEHCLDTWTVESLGEELRRPEWNASWVHLRGAVIQRVFSHDVYHVAEVNESLGRAGLPQVDLWD